MDTMQTETETTTQAESTTEAEADTDAQELLCECAYCHADVIDHGETVPDEDDDRAWAQLATEGHAPDCTWIDTRAHRRTGVLALLSQSGVIDGTGALRTIVEQALSDDPRSTGADLRRIWREATEAHARDLAAEA